MRWRDRVGAWVARNSSMSRRQMERPSPLPDRKSAAPRDVFEKTHTCLHLSAERRGSPCCHRTGCCSLQENCRAPDVWSRGLKEGRFADADAKPYPGIHTPRPYSTLLHSWVILLIGLWQPFMLRRTVIIQTLSNQASQNQYYLNLRRQFLATQRAGLNITMMSKCIGTVELS